MTLTATYYPAATGNGATPLSSPTARVTAGASLLSYGPLQTRVRLPQIVCETFPHFWFDEYSVSAQVLYVIAV